mmetsp:Transcript_14188/g.17865  ORF Transcript_14188/g.17865 Transcript_14188/m.17865 type:complete len:264 (-) Transcript_14188:677-1468(-)
MTSRPPIIITNIHVTKTPILLRIKFIHRRAQILNNRASTVKRRNMQPTSLRPVTPDKKPIHVNTLVVHDTSHAPKIRVVRARVNERGANLSPFLVGFRTEPFSAGLFHAARDFEQRALCRAEVGSDAPRGFLEGGAGGCAGAVVVERARRVGAGAVGVRVGGGGVEEHGGVVRVVVAATAAVVTGRRGGASDGGGFGRAAGAGSIVRRRRRRRCGRDGGAAGTFRGTRRRCFHQRGAAQSDTEESLPGAARHFPAHVRRARAS